MSMVDPGARYRKNPLTSAREFIATEPLAQNTYSGTFQPAITPIEEPMTAGEQALGEVENLQTRLDNTQTGQDDYTVRFIEAANRRQQLQQQADIEQQMQDQYYGQGGQNTGGQYTGPVAGSDIGDLNQTRQDVVRRTASYAGTPYQLGGRTAQGIDCSGLVMAVYNQAGFDISQHSAGWQGRNIPGVRTAVSNLQPGDVVAWKDGSHIAIYAGNGMIWDASRSKGTSMRKLWAPQSAVYGIKLKFPGE